MPPKLRVLAHNARLEEKLQNEISSSLSKVLRTNPNMTPKEAVWSIEKNLLENNPYNPPADGKCPVNDLPEEILTYIFQVGVKMQEEDEWEDDVEDDEWDDMSSEEDSDSESGDLLPPPDSPSTSSEFSVTPEPVSDDEDGDSEDDEPPFQILVSHVCRRWREVALDAHTLWTTLKFENYPKLDQAKMYISRSNDMPLNILIDCTFDEDIDEEDHPDHPLYEENRALRSEIELQNDTRFLSLKDLKAILDLIGPEVSHWGSMDFRASTYGYVQLLLSRLHEMPAAPLLEAFMVYHFEDCEDYEFFSGDDKTPLLPFHGNASNLKTAVFWGVHIDWDAALPRFLNGLHELELSYHSKDVRPSYSTFVQIVKNSPELKTITLSLSGPALPDNITFDAEDGWGPEPLTIPSVKDLALQFQDPRYASAIVQHFDLPAVRNLVLNFDEEDYSDFVRALIRPVKGQKEGLLQRIEHLKVSGLPCDVASVEALLSKLTQLKTLNLKVPGPEELVIYEKLMDPAACRPENAPTTAPPSSSPISPSAPTALIPLDQLPKAFCPKLENLTTTNLEGHQLRPLLAARIKLGVPIKKLMMSQDDMISKKDEKWIRANVEELEFFEPSDSEDDLEVLIEEDDDGSESGGDGDDDDDDSSVDEPLPTPLAHQLGRGGMRRRHGTDLD